MKRKPLVIKVTIDYGDIKEELDITADVSDLDKVEVASLTTGMLSVVGQAIHKRFKDTLLETQTKELIDYIEEIENERKRQA